MRLAHSILKYALITIIKYNHKGTAKELQLVKGNLALVLKGSMELILRDRPVISFEKHISKENLEDISEYIRSFNYRIFMVNEVLPGNALDCRNFLGLPREKGIPNLKEFEQSSSRDIDIYSAVVGPAIIQV